MPSVAVPPRANYFYDILDPIPTHGIFPTFVLIVRRPAVIIFLINIFLFLFHISRQKIQDQKQRIEDEQHLAEAHLARERNDLAVHLMDVARRESSLVADLAHLRRSQGTRLFTSICIILRAFEQ